MHHGSFFIGQVKCSWPLVILLHPHDRLSKFRQHDFPLSLHGRKLTRKPPTSSGKNSTFKVVLRLSDTVGHNINHIIMKKSKKTFYDYYVG